MTQLSETIIANLERMRDEAKQHRDIKKERYYQRQIDQLRETMEKAKQ